MTEHTAEYNEHDLDISTIEGLSLDDLEALVNFDDAEPSHVEIVEESIAGETVELAEKVDDSIIDLDGFGFDIDDELLKIELSDVATVSDDELEALVVGDIESKEVKVSAYETQETETIVDLAPEMSKRLEKALALKEEITSAKPPKIGKSPKEKGDSRKTKYTHDRIALIEDRYGAAFYILEKGDDEGRRDEVIDIIKAMNVKIGEQCVNLYGALGGKATLSVFTKIGLRYLIEKGSIDRSGLHAHYLDGAANGCLSYGVGTANPQTAMCIGLLSALKVIKPLAGGFTINDKSLLLVKLKELV